MPIPLATTTVSTYGRRPLTDIDPDDPARDPATLMQSGIRAVISGPSIVEIDGAQVEAWNLRCDPIDLTHWDEVEDETTGIRYEVGRVAHSRITTFGLNHTHAVLTVVSGLPSEGVTDLDS